MKCWHGRRRLCLRCLAFTVGFPVEHMLWEKAPGFVLLTHTLGL